MHQKKGKRNEGKRNERERERKKIRKEEISRTLETHWTNLTKTFLSLSFLRYGFSIVKSSPDVDLLYPCSD